MVRPSRSFSASARNTEPTTASLGRRVPSSTPLGFWAPAARHVHVPSGRALVSSISILRDIGHHGTGSGALRSNDDCLGTLVHVPIYALGDLTPSIHPDAFVHPDAVVIGDVRIGPQSSVWPGAVLRGDEGYISVGARTSIQDNSVLHTTPEWPTVVGDDCVIGHMVHLEGCTIEAGVLVGNMSVVLHRVIVRTGAIVAANAVVLNDTEVPSRALAVGTPAVIKADRARQSEIDRGVASYVQRTARYKAELRRLDG